MGVWAGQGRLGLTVLRGKKVVILRAVGDRERGLAPKHHDQIRALERHLGRGWQTERRGEMGSRRSVSEGVAVKKQSPDAWLRRRVS